MRIPFHVVGQATADQHWEEFTEIMSGVSEEQRAIFEQAIHCDADIVFASANEFMQTWICKLAQLAFFEIALRIEKRKAETSVDTAPEL